MTNPITTPAAPTAVNKIDSHQLIRMTRLAKVNWTVLLWAIGIPLPLVAIIALMRGCS